MSNQKRYHARLPFYKTNWQIRAPEVRLLEEDGKQVGIVSIDEARRLATEQGLDLVEVASQTRPPVVKIISFSKFKYIENKNAPIDIPTSKKYVRGV